MFNRTSQKAEQALRDIVEMKVSLLQPAPSSPCTQYKPVYNWLDSKEADVQIVFDPFPDFGMS